MNPRDGDVATAGESIVAYEKWLSSGDQSFLDSIELYNEFDCRSTQGLRNWLLTIRPVEAEWFVPDISEEIPHELDDPVRQELKRALKPARKHLGDAVADLLLELNSFHRRADKPAWWEYFDRRFRESEEFIDDLECLGGLSAAAPADGTERTYSSNQAIGVRARWV
jgi:hypothetical protein